MPCCDDDRTQRIARLLLVVVLTMSPLTAYGVDTDSDGVDDTIDNCTLTPNPTQTDTDIDEIGNACDPDFNQDCIVDAADAALLSAAFGGSDPLYDLSEPPDGAVGSADVAVLNSLLGSLPGPSALGCPPGSDERCGTMIGFDQRVANDPAYAAGLAALESFTAAHIQQLEADGGGLRTGIATIPVVVHVVYKNATENISDAQIQSQIDILNEDFRKLNADAGATPGVFKASTADSRVQFVLAKRDPNCNPTTGITRTSTTVPAFSYMNNPIKFAASGGHDAWPRDEYLNFWVGDLGGNLLGYASFPFEPPATDGVVIDFAYFGDIGTATSPYDLGRTATHEVGHYFNLRHIWGDDNGTCTGSDLVDDTPNQADANGACPGFPKISCGNGPNGEMYMNYMDYVYDACMVMFTGGQAARMDAALNMAPRSNLLGSDALVPPAGVPGSDLWSADTPDETGAEANVTSLRFWTSDDIWVRRTNDGFNNQEHQNPLYDPSATDPNYVYVRVRNRGCSTVGSGDVKLYWAKASSALGWPAPFDGSVVSPALMGGSLGIEATGSLAAGDFTILEFEWFPPNPADYASFGADKSHFCLLSRIETSPTAPFGMTFPEGSDLNTNVLENNNIVWKNVVVTDDPNSMRVASLTVGDLTGMPHTMKLDFATDTSNGRTHALEWGRIFVDLGTGLYAKWIAGGSTGAGVQAAGGTSIEVLTEVAWIGNMDIATNELHTIDIAIDPHAPPTEDGFALYWFDVQQLAVAGGGGETLLGGQTFVVKTTPFGFISVPSMTGVALVLLAALLLVSANRVVSGRRGAQTE